MTAHCAPDLDWADDLAGQIVADYSGSGYKYATHCIASKLRLVFMQGELEGLKKAAQLAAVAADAVAETP